MFLNWGKMSPERAEYLWKQAVSHMAFVAELYLEQIREGRLVLHEHPDGASSWDLQCVHDVLNLPGMSSIVSHMCQFGMATVDAEGEALVLKPTRWMSNCPAILEELHRRCPRDHRHGSLMGGRAAAEKSPRQLAALARACAFSFASRSGASVWLGPTPAPGSVDAQRALQQ